MQGKTRPPVSLYNTADVARVRELLYEQQDRIDPITGLEIPKNQIVLDHDHDTMFVRAVLHRQTNAVAGKAERFWDRYLAWWYTGTLQDFLRGCADYLDRKHPQEYYHPSWIKKVKTEFNKLNSSQKTKVLESFNSATGTNDTQRKANFKKLLTKRMNLGYDAILQAIEKSKEVV